MIFWPHQSIRPFRWVQACEVSLLCFFFVFGALPSSLKANEIEPDVCKDIPGTVVAQAVSGKFQETKSYEGRCVYFLSSKNTPDKIEAFVVYRHPADDFAGLKEAEEGKGEVVEGVGDEASLTFDKETNRFWLLVTKHGLVTLQISGEDKEAVHKIAAAVIKAYMNR